MAQSAALYERVASAPPVPRGLPLVIALTGFTDAGSAVSRLVDYFRDDLEPTPVAVFSNDVLLDYRARRDSLLPVLADAGFTFSTPEGAYYVLSDFSGLSDKNDVEFAKWMAAEVGVAGVPGSSFYHAGAGRGKSMIRFAFCKKQETLDRAAERLASLSARV